MPSTTIRALFQPIIAGLKEILSAQNAMTVRLRMDGNEEWRASSLHATALAARLEDLMHILGLDI